MSRGEINFNFLYHKSMGIKTVEARCANAIDFFKINFTKKVSFPGCYAPTKKSLCSTSSRHLMCDEWWSSDAHVHE